MSDSEKPTPESPGVAGRDVEPERSSLAGNVISIEQARAELLRKPRVRPAPRGVVDLSRHRGREVPSPVTMPPGEHAAVIVTDTPAARAHFDKRTVHPGEAPEQVHHKKVRVKTSLDPRRAKTQLSEKRSSQPGIAGPDSIPTPLPVAEVDDGGVASLWDTPSIPPPSLRGQGHMRGSLTRPERIPGVPNRGSPVFLVGVAIVAALGAVLVYWLSHHGGEAVSPSAPASTELTVPTSLRIGGPPAGSSAATVAHPGVTSPSTAVPSTSVASTSVASTAVPATSELPSVGVTATAPATSPSTVKTAKTTPSAKPSATASAKPTATSILPFGKEEP